MAEQSNGNGTSIRIKTYWLPIIAIVLFNLFGQVVIFGGLRSDVANLKDQVSHLSDQFTRYLIYSRSHASPQGDQ